MTQKEFDKIIDKAIKNGWEDSWRPWVEDAYELIYNHGFAKALWGEEPISYTTSITEETHGEYKKLLDPPTIDELYALTNWQHHLQQMVISKDPLNYLRNNT